MQPPPTSAPHFFRFDCFRTWARLKRPRESKFDASASLSTAATEEYRRFETYHSMKTIRELPLDWKVPGEWNIELQRAPWNARVSE